METHDIFDAVRQPFGMIFNARQPAGWVRFVTEHREGT